METMKDTRGRKRDEHIEKVCCRLRKMVKEVPPPFSMKFPFKSSKEALEIDVRTYAHKIRTSQSLRDVKAEFPERRFILAPKGAGGSDKNCVYVTVRKKDE
jgi:hypothetical protein